MVAKEKEIKIRKMKKKQRKQCNSCKNSINLLYLINILAAIEIRCNLFPFVATVITLLIFTIIA